MTRIVKHPETRRAEIVDAARTLFESQGYGATTMQDVMRQLDIAKGTIYHYFKSKDELLDAVVAHIVDEDIERKRAMLAQLQGNALEKIRTLILGNTLDSENANLLSHLHQPENASLHTRVLGLALLKQAPLYAELIRLGCDEGLFNTEHPLECAEFILAAVQFLTDIGVYPWESRDIARRSHALPALIARQLGASLDAFDFLLPK